MTISLVTIQEEKLLNDFVYSVEMKYRELVHPTEDLPRKNMNGLSIVPKNVQRNREAEKILQIGKAEGASIKTAISMF